MKMNVKVPYLTKCCRRYTLKFGTKIVGWYSLITAVFGLLNGFLDFADVTYYEYPKVAADLVKLKIMFCLFDTTISVILLLGLYLERPPYYLFWIVAKFMLLLCEVPLYILMSNFDKLCYALAFFLFFMGVDIYSLLVIHGYYMEVSQVGESEV